MDALGIDFGRVIQGAPGPDGEVDTDFLGSSLEEAVESPPAAGAFTVIPHLVTHFERRVWIISKCGESTQRKTLAWLEHHDFYDRTGLPRDHVRCCRHRADKAAHCRELGITHMIDDRLDVLQFLRGLVPQLYLFGLGQEAVPAWVTPAPDWATVAALILERAS